MSAISALFVKSKCHLANTARVIREQSKFKIFFILGFALALESGLFFLFIDVFNFIASLGGIGTMIIGRLFSLAFLGMGAMLIISSIVTTYATMYRSDEVPFLIVRPFDISHITIYKFFQSSLLSSWSFCFIIIPFVGAYAWHEKMSIFVALWTLIFSLPFLFLCSAIGSIIVMIVVRWFPIGPAIRKTAVWSLAVIMIVSMWILSRQVKVYSTEIQFSIGKFVPGLVLASNALLPSWWVSEGIMCLSRGEWSRGIMLWLMLFSTGMTGCICMEWLGYKTFYESWQRVNGSKGYAKHKPILFPWLNRCLKWLTGDIRAMVIKDIRIFFRDPMQWSQALIFFGLLGLYFAHLRSFGYKNFMSGLWLNIIAFVNVFSVSAVICSLGSRFVYPQLSLEGHGFWVLGLAPTTVTRILITKFIVAASGMLAVSVSLILLSGSMLGIDPSITYTTIFLVSAVSLAVSALATGLGAIFIDLRERNPAAIVSGFGGTLNLVLSLAFMLCAIVPFGTIFHLHTILKISDAQLNKDLFWCFAWLITITIVAIFTPLACGVKSLRHHDF